MPLLLQPLHNQTISSSHNPKPKSPSPHPPLLLRFRPSDRQIAQHLNTLGIRASPSSSSESLHWMLSVVNYFESKGFSNIHFPRLFHLCPQMFSSADLNRTIAPVFSFLISELGASTEHLDLGSGFWRAWVFLTRNPLGFADDFRLFFDSEENNLRPKFEYLLYEMGGSVEEVKRFPQYFGFCLKKRIVPRHLHLKQRNIRPSLKWMLMPGDKVLWQVEIELLEQLGYDFAILSFLS
ncbi:hypothetical protein MA16_Dca020778 [Dendrobium catenatum]|uniref:Transcription termination factor MTEF1, chloroplastic n=1 Tax=Dendrobium catenatum TaxID=906689 RepID=A0A2I0WDN8_9ASPA|nr:hypothetical protein MA16_Dca020778 [Dendrobium catenatum]